MRTLLTIVLCAFVASTNAAAAVPDGGPRIRPQDDRSRSLLAAGAARSSTVRELIDRVEDSNVIVYVGVSPLLKSTLAGRVTWMTQAGDYRYLRITVSTDLTFDQAIASLAHELQHVVEVIDDPGVVDERTLVALYKRIGHPSRAAASAGWETVAAQEAGTRARRELSAALKVTDGDEM